jgi:hypothetical protein
MTKLSKRAITVVANLSLWKLEIGHSLPRAIAPLPPVGFAMPGRQRGIPVLHGYRDRVTRGSRSKHELSRMVVCSG